MSPEEVAKKQNYLNKLLSGQFRDKNIMLNNILEESDKVGTKNMSPSEAISMVSRNAKKLTSQVKEYAPEPSVEIYESSTQNFKFGEAAILESKSVTEEQIARLTGRAMPKKPLSQAPAPVGQQFLYEEKIPQQKTNNNNINVDINQLKEQLKAELFEDMKDEINMYILEMFAKQRIKGIIKEIFDESKKK
jgi:hypothetical protein